ncbi:MAG TPA: TerC family protein [Gemmatimonadaceae bacterium]|nr:TerC family protein [Gemmatimonadaceae bacterium]
MNLEMFTQAETWLSLVTLTVMEIVLGIDNVVFISILVDKLPGNQQGRARKLGLSLALILRLALLFAITWVMGLTEPLISAIGREFSGRDLILLGGGLFLIAKATREIHENLEVAEHPRKVPSGRGAFGFILVQILLLDVVFSLDSVITAVGMARHIAVMVIAMVAAVGVMLAFSGNIATFVNRHPSMKMLALSFLLLIGVVLVADGMGQHVGKGYIYFAMAFSFGVELLNMRVRGKSAPVHMHNRYAEDA